MARDLALVAALVVLVGVPSLFTRDLWNPDEPRQCEVAREMVVLGDYLLPHLNGEPYAEKGPLFFWLTAGFWKLGAGYNSGRIVALLSVFGTLALAYLAVRKSLGATGAMLAVAVALSTLLLFKYVRWGVVDPLLMFTVTGAMFSGYWALHAQSSRRGLFWLACYAAMALGVLNKGPVGVLVPGLTLLVYGTLNRKRVRGGGWFHLAGVALFLVMVLAWVIPACIAGGEQYTDTILLKQHLGRAVRSYSHRKPFYYFIWMGPLMLMPWALVLPLAVIAVVRRRGNEREDLPVLAASWLIVPLIFFSCISGKRANYILPIAPAAGILVGWYFTAQGVRQGRSLAAGKTLLSIAFAALIAVGAALILVVALARPLLGSEKLLALAGAQPGQLAHVRAFVTPWRALLAVALLALPVGLSVWGLRTGPERPVRRAAILAGAVLALSPALDLVLTPMANRVKSGKHFALAVNSRADPDQTIYLFGDNFSGLFNLYTGRVHMPLLELEDEDWLRDLLSTPGELIITRRKRLQKVLSAAQQEPYVVLEQRIGHRQVLLLEGRAPARGEEAAGSM